MTATTGDIVAERFYSSFILPDRRPIYEWAHDNVFLPAKGYSVEGRFDVSPSPYLRQVFDWLHDRSTREVVLLKGVKVGGTLISDVWLASIIARDPGPCGWFGPTNDFMRHHAEAKLMPLLERCPEVAAKLPTGAYRHKKRTTAIHFADMWLSMEGANDTNLQGKDCRYVSGTENFEWQPGMLDQSRARTTAFRHNCKRFYESQGGVTGDDLDTAFKNGDCCEWGFTCPKCGTAQSWAMYEDRDDKTKCGLLWDTNERTFRDGAWVEHEVRATVRYECRNVSCKAAFRDTAAERALLMSRGLFIQTNPYPAPGVHSARVSSLATMDWCELSKMWRDAMKLYRNGSVELVKQFKQKRLAICFDETEVFPDSYEIKPGDCVLGEKWAKEKIRFLVVDKQKDYMRFVCLAAGDGGECRVIEAGSVGNESELVAKQIELGVDDDCVAVDEGFEQDEVRAMCAAHNKPDPEAVCGWSGWWSFKGDDEIQFPWKDETGKLFYRAHSQPVAVDANIGTTGQGRSKCRFVRWSNERYKDRLWMHSTGRGPYFGVPSDIEKIAPWFWKEMRAEAKKKVFNARGFAVLRWERLGKRPNHTWDCLCEGFVLMDMADLLPGTTTPEAENAEEKSEHKTP